MRILCLFVVFGLCSGAAADDGAPPHWNYMSHTKTQWHAYGKPAFRLAKESGRPVFVLVYSDKCSWCVRYEKEVLETTRVRQQLATDFVPVAVDVEQQRPLAKKLKAKLVPTTLILAPDGTKLLRFHGVSSPGEISETLQQVVTAWRRGKLPEVDDFGTQEHCCPIEP